MGTVGIRCTVTVDRRGWPAICEVMPPPPTMLFIMAGSPEPTVRHLLPEEALVVITEADGVVFVVT